MRFVALTPARLVADLADRVERLAGRAEPRAPGRPGGSVIGFDGPGECGVGKLADGVAQELRSRGHAVIRASTQWWWRPAALRLEWGREDVDMLLTGWVDADALRRELVAPVTAGVGSFISRLRDPLTDRSVRQPPELVPERAQVLLDGPFLLGTEVPLDLHVGFRLGRGTVLRSLPPERQWWARALETYEDRYLPLEGADVVLAYDHPAAPAVAGPSDDRPLRSGHR